MDFNISDVFQPIVSVICIIHVLFKINGSILNIFLKEIKKEKASKRLM